MLYQRLPQWDAFLPSRSRRAAELIAFLAREAGRMHGDAAAAWRAQVHDLYGDLSGQRSLERDKQIQRLVAAARGASLPDLVIALQTYYALICDALALGQLGTGAVPSLPEMAACPSARFLRALEELATGRLFRGLGVQPAGNPLPLDWYLGGVSSKESALFRETFADLAAFGDLPPFVDLPQRIYAGLMPRNLLHVLGEFYTPPWLARLLLDDAGWEPTQTLVDPFAGSGVFLLAAIEKAASRGCACREVLPNLQAIDRNPVAYVALRANLLIALARDPGSRCDGVRLPIRCADALLRCPLATAPGAADVLVTNPPWVGWEYISRPYRTRLAPAWREYGLYTARGRDAAFLKEDLSTLALVAAWDRFLKAGGTSALVVRPAAMQSHLAARGLRRLSLFPDAGPLALRLIRVFTGLKVFSGTDAPAAAWCVVKGAPTAFPVPVVEWCPKKAGWRFDPSDSLADVRRNVAERRLAAERSDPCDPGSPWTIGDPLCQQATRALPGSNAYTVRAGVFTGGANAVYYLQRTGAGRYRNVVVGTKRRVEAGECEVEDDLVNEVVRGRDLELWRATPGALLLCPHTARTRMRPIPPADMERAYPKALAYLQAMRPALEARQGFAGWEKHIREQTYYAIQRIGEYTFAPFKAAWRYIASDFIVAVVGPGRNGRPRLCNDKVMYIACASEEEAYYLCGLLSSDPVRWRVVSTMTGTQISTSAVKHLNLPAFSADDPTQAEIARQCKKGHEAVLIGEPRAAAKALAAVNRAVGRLYRLTEQEQQTVQEEVRRRYGANRFT